VRRYRYRTSVLTGPWRESREEALCDAVRAKQAEIEDDNVSRVRWIVPGVIEEHSGEASGLAGG
jgi:hypothetical protein